MNRTYSASKDMEILVDTYLGCEREGTPRPLLRVPRGPIEPPAIAKNKRDLIGREMFLFGCQLSMHANYRVDGNSLRAYPRRPPLHPGRAIGKIMDVPYF